MLFILPLLFFGCQNAPSSSAIDTQMRDVDAFHAVHFSGHGTLYLKEGADNTVKVVAEKHIQEHVNIVTQDGTLRVQVGSMLVQRPVKHSQEIKIYVTAKSINAITLAGKTAVNTQGMLSSKTLHIDQSGASNGNFHIKCDQLHVEMNGAGGIEINGTAGTQDLYFAGTTHYNAQNLVSKQVKVIAFGASNVSLNVHDTLHAEVSGSAHVTYRGTPTITKEIYGSGILIKK